MSSSILNIAVWLSIVLKIHRADLTRIISTYSNVPHVEHKNDLSTDYDWDILIFSQQWPVTTCYHWKKEDKSHTCTLPDEKELWTIHGIWPTKLGHIGPNFCNASAKFNISELENIEKGLKKYWPDIESQAYDSLWKHEWLKHGTCAIALETLDNEFKYFNQGLKWHEKFTISNLLNTAGIHPGSNHSVLFLQKTLFNVLKTNPAIHCLYDHEKDLSFLSEIRICFNKTLQVIDCDGVRQNMEVELSDGTPITNCFVSKPVYYPGNMPIIHKEIKRKESSLIVDVFKLLQFIMWFTL